MDDHLDMAGSKYIIKAKQKKVSHYGKYLTQSHILYKCTNPWHREGVTQSCLFLKCLASAEQVHVIQIWIDHFVDYTSKVSSKVLNGILKLTDTL